MKKKNTRIYRYSLGYKKYTWFCRHLVTHIHAQNEFFIRGTSSLVSEASVGEL